VLVVLVQLHLLAALMVIIQFFQPLLLQLVAVVVLLPLLLRLVIMAALVVEQVARVQVQQQVVLELLIKVLQVQV
jgi:hypothetical protein